MGHAAAHRILAAERLFGVRYVPVVRLRTDVAARRYWGRNVSLECGAGRWLAGAWLGHNGPGLGGTTGHLAYCCVLLAHLAARFPRRADPIGPVGASH